MEASKVKSKAKGKRKMDDDTRSYFVWNLEMERALADILKDQRSLGNQSDGAQKSVAYNTAAQVLSTHFHIQLMGENVKNCIKLWRGWYRIVSDILSQSGFDWDDTEYMINVENENAWREYVKVEDTYMSLESWSMMKPIPLDSSLLLQTLSMIYGLYLCNSSKRLM